MSRAVVVGPYPPTVDAGGATTLAEVRALRAAGHDVLVISPEPSAARVAASPTTRSGARRIARLVRGANIVVWVGAEPPDAVARLLRDVADVRMIGSAAPRAERASAIERVEPRAPARQRWFAACGRAAPDRHLRDAACLLEQARSLELQCRVTALNVQKTIAE